MKHHRIVVEYVLDLGDITEDEALVATKKIEWLFSLTIKANDLPGRLLTTLQEAQEREEERPN